MDKVLNPNQNFGGSRISNEPQQIGAVIDILLHNILLLKNIHPNTELSVDLKLLTREHGRLKLGKMIPGAITRDGEMHFTFVEGVSEKKIECAKRNPSILQGKYINVHCKTDGTLYLTFKRPTYNEEFSFRDFCILAAKELRTIADLVEEMGSIE